MTIMKGYHGRLLGDELGVISYILNASKYKCYSFLYLRVKYMAICTYLHLFVTKRFQGEEECLLNVFSTWVL